jgi:hypothetical protein
VIHGSAIRQKLRRQIDELYDDGVALLMYELPEAALPAGAGQPVLRDKQPPIQITYQNWYCKALPLVERLLPERADEFRQQYRADEPAETTYCISDFLVGLPLAGRGGLPPRTAFTSKFHHQLMILGSARDRIDERYDDVASAIEIALLDRQLEVARSLLARSRARAAGVIAATVLCEELRLVCVHTGTLPPEGRNSLGDYNDALQDAGLTNPDAWRFIRRLGQIADACLGGSAHVPSAFDVEELLEGTKYVRRLIC